MATAKKDAKKAPAKAAPAKRSPKEAPAKQEKRTDYPGPSPR